MKNKKSNKWRYIFPRLKQTQIRHEYYAKNCIRKLNEVEMVEMRERKSSHKLTYVEMTAGGREVEIDEEKALTLPHFHLLYSYFSSWHWRCFRWRCARWSNMSGLSSLLTCDLLHFDLWPTATDLPDLRNESYTHMYMYSQLLLHLESLSHTHACSIQE